MQKTGKGQNKTQEKGKQKKEKSSSIHLLQ